MNGDKALTDHDKPTVMEEESQDLINDDGLNGDNNMDETLVHETTSNVNGSFDANKSMQIFETNLSNEDIVVALFSVPLSSTEDVDVLIKKIEAGDYDELKEGVFSKDGISLIASQIGKPIMLDSFTSRCVLSRGGQSSFARCLIEIKVDEPLQDSVTMGIPLPNGEGFIKGTVRIKYEWKPPRCEQCKIYGHMDDQCPKKAENTPNVVNNDGFQTVVNKKKSGKTGPTVVKTTWQPITQKVRFDPKSHGESKKANDGNNVHSVSKEKPTKSDEDVEVVFDETNNLLGNNITRATFTAPDASKT
nr:hypothetical protein [Tanacetum cinerariifolium]